MTNTYTQEAAPFVGDNGLNLAALFAATDGMDLATRGRVNDYLVGALSCYIPAPQFADLVASAVRAL